MLCCSVCFLLILLRQEEANGHPSLQANLEFVIIYKNKKKLYKLHSSNNQSHFLDKENQDQIIPGQAVKTGGCISRGG